MISSNVRRPWLSSYASGVAAEVTVPDEPLTAALERAAERFPDRVALDFMGSSTTYSEQIGRAHV